jgi:methyl-accepting chemotaxis protein
VRIAFGLMIESLVAILLLLTIAYCVLLNKRLKSLKEDEHALKATISELVASTENAERAIAGLKVTAHDCNQTLGERLRSAENLSADLQQQIARAETVTNRISRIVNAARPLEETSGGGRDARAVAAAAQAFAERTRARRNGLAA